MLYQIGLQVNELFYDEEETETRTVRIQEEGNRIVEENDRSLEITLKNEYWSNSSSDDSSTDDSLNTSVKSQNLHKFDLRNWLNQNRVRDSPYKVIFESILLNEVKFLLIFNFREATREGGGRRRKRTERRSRLNTQHFVVKIA